MCRRQPGGVEFTRDEIGQKETEGSTKKRIRALDSADGAKKSLRVLVVAEKVAFVVGTMIRVTSSLCRRGLARSAIQYPSIASSRHRNLRWSALSRESKGSMLDLDEFGGDGGGTKKRSKKLMLSSNESTSVH